MTPHRRHLLLTVKTAMDSVPLLYARFRRALLADARTGGPAAVQRQYMARFSQYVAEPRRALMVAGAHAHPWVGHPAAPTAAVAAAAQRVALRALTHQRRGGWRITDLEWPSDRYVQGLFFSTWDAWRRRAGSALRAAADDEDADVDEDAPSIDPARRKIAYPFDEDVTDIDPEELVDDALDDVVLCRGGHPGPGPRGGPLDVRYGNSWPGSADHRVALDPQRLAQVQQAGRRSVRDAGHG